MDTIITEFAIKHAPKLLAIMGKSSKDLLDPKSDDHESDSESDTEGEDEDDKKKKKRQKKGKKSKKKSASSSKSATKTDQQSGQKPKTKGGDKPLNKVVVTDLGNGAVRLSVPCAECKSTTMVNYRPRRAPRTLPVQEANVKEHLRQVYQSYLYMFDPPVDQYVRDDRITIYTQIKFQMTDNVFVPGVGPCVEDKTGRQHLFLSNVLAVTGQSTAMLNSIFRELKRYQPDTLLARSIISRFTHTDRLGAIPTLGRKHRLIRLTDEHAAAIARIFQSYQPTEKKAEPGSASYLTWNKDIPTCIELASLLLPIQEAAIDKLEEDRKTIGATIVNPETDSLDNFNIYAYAVAVEKASKTAKYDMLNNYAQLRSSIEAISLLLDTYGMYIVYEEALNKIIGVIADFIHHLSINLKLSEEEFANLYKSHHAYATMVEAYMAVHHAMIALKFWPGRGDHPFHVSRQVPTPPGLAQQLHYSNVDKPPNRLKWVRRLVHQFADIEIDTTDLANHYRVKNPDLAVGLIHALIDYHTQIAAATPERPAPPGRAPA